MQERTKKSERQPQQQRQHPIDNGQQRCVATGFELFSIIKILSFGDLSAGSLSF